jgi:AsmA family protein
MSRKRYWLLGGLVAVATVLVAIALGVALFDWNHTRGWLGQKVFERTGRELKIEGNLRVHPFSLSPRIRAEHITFANAEWGEDRSMFSADSVDVSVDLLSLLRGRLVFEEIAAGDAELLLERDSEGRNNWTLDARREEPKDGGEPPTVRRFSVNGLAVTVRDVPVDTEVQVTAQSLTEGDGIEFDVKGKLRGVKMAIRGAGGAPHTLLDRATPYPLRFSGKLGDGSVSFDGTVTGLPAPKAIDARATVTGRNLSVLADALGLTAPDTAPYKIKGQLGLDGKSWHLTDVNGTVGKSDLRGNVSVDLAGGRPQLKAKLESKQLDIGDLAGFVGAKPGEKPKEKTGKVLPAEPLKPESLRRLDAQVTLTAGSFRNRDMLPLDDLNATMALNEGVMKVEPLRFGVAGGRLNARVDVDARQDTMMVSIDSTMRGLHINRLIPGSDVLDASFGAIDGRIELVGRGNSTAAVLGTSHGNVDLVSGGGQVSNLLVEVAGLDIAEAVKFFVGGDQTIQLRCGVVAFAVTDGVMKSKAIVIDTDDTYIGGEGSVSLRDERLDLKLTPLPKDISILSLRGPLRARGTFAKPNLGVEKRSLARKVGTAVMLALVTPVAAIIPTIETGPGKEAYAQCAELVESLEANVKGGKAKVVPAKRKKELEASDDAARQKVEKEKAR